MLEVKLNEIDIGIEKVTKKFGNLWSSLKMRLMLLLGQGRFSKFSIVHS